jgi:hypothetical protein
MTFHKWMVGFALAVIMVAALIANAILFSARSFQHHLAEIAPQSSGIINVQRFWTAEGQIAEIEKGIAPQRGEILSAQQNVADLEKKVQDLAQQATEASVNLSMSLSALETRLGVERAATPAGEDGLSIDAFDATARLAEVAAAPTAADEDRAAIAALKTTADRLQQLERDAETAVVELESARQRLRAAASSVADADRQILGVKAQVVPGGFDDYDVIRSETLALQKSSPLGFGLTLAQTHPHFLSSILVLVMGALGGILYLFPAYMSRPSPVTFAEIVVRMIFGMCAALAFYIVVNATIAGFAFVPGAEGGQAALNPFSVSLIGIVAGVMADDIAKWIRNRGSELLGGGPSQGGGLAPQPAPAPAPAVAPASAPEAATFDPYEGGAMGPGATLGLADDPFRSAAQDAASAASRSGDPGAGAPPPGGVIRRDG